MEEIFEKLTEYTLALNEGLETTNQANERPLLTKHLAAAAEMFALLHQSGNAESIHDLVATEIRGHGWSFISGTAGEKIANKWVAFTDSMGMPQ
ncbi:hypothetical protein [Microbulbifer aggregans]|uniref:hypothetical protein n=1 Tax=Microbulbifer aggregans TaxID=1769779 RepID=UPI0011AB4F56|nr:hypothetical protein [Microbulbifer aggregans]